MTIWTDILKSAALSDTNRAYQLLRQQLPLALRSFVYGTATERYAGPVPRAVRIFTSRLSEPERTLAASYQDELVDSIVDSIVSQVEQTLCFVVNCHTTPATSFEALVEGYPWDANLKRDFHWKADRVADLVQSMYCQEILLPSHVQMLVGKRGQPKFRFDEIASAVSAERLKLSWSDFRKTIEQEIGYISLVEEDPRETVDGEGSDFGVMWLARAMLQSGTGLEPELWIDLARVGVVVSREVTTLVEQFQVEKPADGYPPIAWHNVFWNLASEYEGLRLAIETRDPFKDKDEELGRLIAATYQEVVSTSRPVILRRRTRLRGACETVIQQHLTKLVDTQ